MNRADKESSGAEAPQILVLGKALSILDAFTPERPALALAEIRRTTGLPASTCLRLVRDLVAHEVLTYDGTEYRVGMSVFRWARSAEAGFSLATIEPLVAQLRDALKETCGLFIRSGTERVCVAVAEDTANHSLIRKLYKGHALPLYVGSPGKVLLAFDTQAQELLGGRSLVAMTDHTITDRDALARELDQIRRQGYAASFGEWESDLAGVAAPVFDREGQIVGALAVSAPISRMSLKSLSRTAATVTQIAAEASTRLGHPRK